MNAVIWSGATNAADLFFLIAAILAGIAAIMDLAKQVPEAAAYPAAICLVALGLLAL